MKFIAEMPVVPMDGYVAYQVVHAEEKICGSEKNNGVPMMTLYLNLIDEGGRKNYNIQSNLLSNLSWLIKKFFVSNCRLDLNESGDIQPDQLIGLTGYAKVLTESNAYGNSINVKEWCDRDAIVKPDIDFDDFNKPLVTTNQQPTSPEPEADNFDDSDIPF